MHQDYQKKILTIPNLLSFLRLCMIPVILWLYLARQAYHPAAAMLILSGITDIADGIIARRFHMVSDFGKAFDPVADKLTQAAVLSCLVSTHHTALLPLVVLAAKELIAAITGIMTIRKTGEVMGALWHGKAATAALYSVISLHFFWPEIPGVFSDILLLSCTALLLLSGVLYSIRNLRVISANSTEETA